MKNWKLYLGIVLIFVLGILLGTVSTGIYIRHKIITLIEGGSAARKAFIMQRLSCELHLTPSQRHEINKIVETSTEKIRRYRSQHLPQLRAILQGGIAEIREKLDQTQRKKFEVLCQKLDKALGP